MLQGGYKCLLRSKFWEVLSSFIFIHERHKYQLKKQKKTLLDLLLERPWTSHTDVPGRPVQTSGE